MNPYEFIKMIQEKMKDPQFAQKFNNIVTQLSSIPGLQQEVMRISQIQDEKKRQKALDKLPPDAKKAAKDFTDLLNETRK